MARFKNKPNFRRICRLSAIVSRHLENPRVAHALTTPFLLSGFLHVSFALDPKDNFECSRSFRESSLFPWYTLGKEREIRLFPHTFPFQIFFSRKKWHGPDIKNSETTWSYRESMIHKIDLTKIREPVRVRYSLSLSLSLSLSFSLFLAFFDKSAANENRGRKEDYFIISRRIDATV